MTRFFPGRGCPEGAGVGWRARRFAGSLRLCARRKITARIPHPSRLRRATFSPGEGIGGSEDGTLPSVPNGCNDNRRTGHALSAGIARPANQTRIRYRPCRSSVPNGCNDNHRTGHALVVGLADRADNGIRPYDQYQKIYRIGETDSDSPRAAFGGCSLGRACGRSATSLRDSQ